MIKEKNKKIFNQIENILSKNSNIYLIDISGMNANLLANFRISCYTYKVFLKVIKNNLLKKAIKNKPKWIPSLKIIRGCTALMINPIPKMTAKIIQKFRKQNNSDKPLLKAAYIGDDYYIGDLNVLAKMKSKEEFISDLIILLKSKLKNILRSLADYYQIIIFEFLSFQKKQVNN